MNELVKLIEGVWNELELESPCVGWVDINYNVGL